MKKTIKSVLLVLMTVCLAVFLCSCGGSSGNQVPDSQVYELLKEYTIDNVWHNYNRFENNNKFKLTYTAAHNYDSERHIDTVTISPTYTCEYTALQGLQIVARYQYEKSNDLWRSLGYTVINDNAKCVILPEKLKGQTIEINKDTLFDSKGTVKIVYLTDNTVTIEYNIILIDKSATQTINGRSTATLESYNKSPSCWANFEFTPPTGWHKSVFSSGTKDVIALHLSISDGWSGQKLEDALSAIISSTIIYSNK